MAPIPFQRETAVDYAVLKTESPLVRRIICRNPGPFTAAGTSTFVVGRGRVAVIDPGPAIDEHLQAILASLTNETIAQILVTHTHGDHSPGVPALRAATGATVSGFGLQIEGGDRAFVADRYLKHGDVVAEDGWTLTAVHTPGHASNHLCYGLAEEKVLFSGDHVMGWSTSVITPPDGRLDDYLRTLGQLLQRDDRLYWPAHGPSLADPKSFVQALIDHRQERSRLILAYLDRGEATIPEIVEGVYIGLAANLKTAAARTVVAHLIALIAGGDVVTDGEPRPTGRYRRS